MRETLLKFVETVFADAENYEAPEGYQRNWLIPERGPAEFYEEMELYLDQHHSVFDVEFPELGVAYPPEWAEIRVATSLCYIVLEHPLIVTDDWHAGSMLDDLVYAYSKEHDDGELPYRSLNDDQWGAFLSVFLWAISEAGPVKRWETCLEGIHIELRSIVCRMATSRHLPSLDDTHIAGYLWTELEKLEQPDFEEAMRPPRY